MWAIESADAKPAERSGAGPGRARPPAEVLARAVATSGARLARRWLLLANLSCALVLAGALGVAYLRSLGATWLSEPLSTAYLLLCPQRPAHSYFPFGYQMALEQREVAMFGAQLLGGLAFGLVGGRLRPLKWEYMLLLGLPLAWDVLSQVIRLRESDWLARTWTGALFSLGLVFWAYPLIDRVLWSERAARRRSAGG